MRAEVYVRRSTGRLEKRGTVEPAKWRDDETPQQSVTRILERDGGTMAALVTVARLVRTNQPGTRRYEHWLACFRILKNKRDAEAGRAVDLASAPQPNAAPAPRRRRVLEPLQPMPVSQGPRVISIPGRREPKPSAVPKSHRPPGSGQPVDRTAQALGPALDIDPLRGPAVAVTEHGGNLADLGAVVGKPGRDAVPERVRGEVRQAGPGGRGLERPARVADRAAAEVNDVPTRARLSPRLEKRRAERIVDRHRGATLARLRLLGVGEVDDPGLEVDAIPRQAADRTGPGAGVDGEQHEQADVRGLARGNQTGRLSARDPALPGLRSRRRLHGG